MMDVQFITRLLGGTLRGSANTRVDRIRPLSSPEHGGLAIVYSQSDLAISATARVDVLIGPPGTQCPQAQSIVEVDVLDAQRLNGLLRYYRGIRYRLDDQANTSTIPDVYIGKYTRIGQGCRLMPGVRIMNGVTLGDHVAIHCNTVVKEGTEIGDNVVIDSNCSIGNFSFEYMGGTGTKYARLESVGRVRIGDDVEIGSNCTIDRGTFGDTLVGAGTKIDNLVQIGHDVAIGRNCLIVAQTGIAGHTVLEDDVILHGQVGLAGHLTVGARSVVQAGSGLSQSCGPDSVLFGYPARDARTYLKAIAPLDRLARKT
jgi:UDP-3-O-[3-hydroxymyristoyl] glucosamine N-acyltransferase